MFYTICQASFLSHRCLVMADKLANALEMLIKTGDMKRAADILEQGYSKKREQQPSKLSLATNLPASCRHQ